MEQQFGQDNNMSVILNHLHTDVVSEIRTLFIALKEMRLKIQSNVNESLLDMSFDIDDL